MKALIWQDGIIAREGMFHHCPVGLLLLYHDTVTIILLSHVFMVHVTIVPITFLLITVQGKGITTCYDSNMQNNKPRVQVMLLLIVQPGHALMRVIGYLQASSGVGSTTRVCSSVRLWSKRRFLATEFDGTIIMRGGIRTLVLILRGTLSNFYLRKGFEVCGILEDVYVARKRNKRGQPYGFVRFSNVRDITKLTKALNVVSFGDFCVRARIARFDRNDEPFDESARAGVEKFRGVVLVDAKPKEQIASDVIGKPCVDEQPQNDTSAPVTQEGLTIGNVLVRLGDGNGKSRVGAQK
jgi:hypothetical protein